MKKRKADATPEENSRCLKNRKSIIGSDVVSSLKINPVKDTIEVKNKATIRQSRYPKSGLHVIACRKLLRDTVNSKAPIQSK